MKTIFVYICGCVFVRQYSILYVNLPLCINTYICNVYVCMWALACVYVSSVQLYVCVHLCFCIYIHTSIVRRRHFFKLPSAWTRCYSMLIRRISVNYFYRVKNSHFPIDDLFDLDIRLICLAILLFLQKILFFMITMFILWKLPLFLAHSLAHSIHLICNFWEIKISILFSEIFRAEFRALILNWYPNYSLQKTHSFGIRGHRTMTNSFSAVFHSFFQNAAATAAAVTRLEHYYLYYEKHSHICVYIYTRALLSNIH